MFEIWKPTVSFSSHGAVLIDGLGGGVPGYIAGSGAAGIVYDRVVHRLSSDWDYQSILREANAEN